MQKFRKVVIISGTSSGIGKYLASKLSKKYIVIGFSRRKKTIKDKNYYHHVLDINDFKKTNRFIEKIFLKFKKIDVLINNAATNISHGNFYFATKDLVEKTINTNLTSTILFTNMVIKKMISKRSGNIINIGSGVVGLLPKGDSVYAASKAGLEGFSKILSKELKEFNISSNLIAPFIVETPMIKKINKDKINTILKNSNKNKNKLVDILMIVENIMRSNRINSKNFYI